MPTIVDVLLKVFLHEAQQARCVLEAIKDTDLNYSPKEGMRTLGELANHLAQIPLLDPSMYSQEIADLKQAQAREKALKRNTLPELLTVFDEGIDAVQTRFSKMSETTFFAKTLQPFYEQGDKKSWAYYMPEFITHIAMHKMQLWMYLKLAGVKVNMMTYYGHSLE
ncbi:MAG: DinB family protein [Candidatus Thorarchaeota archaeon]